MNGVPLGPQTEFQAGPNVKTSWHNMPCCQISVEKEIIYYADKRVMHDKIVTLLSMEEWKRNLALYRGDKEGRT